MEHLLSRANEELKKRGFDESAILVGSVAKGTYLKDPDIDIFLRFPSTLERTELKKLGIEIGKSILPDGFAKYAEHPYWRGTYNGFDVDIVPCYKIDNPSERITAVDRTPFHTEYIKSHLKDGQRDEVRILKAFLKGIGAYGAEAKIQGVSGYLAELLVLKYGDFKSVLEGMSKWRKRVHLYLEERGARFRAPVVFIDPVDPNRNAASAVSDEKKSLLIYAAKSYLEGPKLEFFFPREVEPLSKKDIEKEIRRRGTQFYVIEAPKPDIIEDNLYPQIGRSMESFSKILSEFNVISHFYVVREHKVYFILELGTALLPRVKVHEGPPVWHENSKSFLDRWREQSLRGPYISGSRWFVDVERTRITPEDVFFKELGNYKLGKEFEKEKHNLVFGSLDEFLEEINGKEVAEFFRFRFPWER